MIIINKIKEFSKKHYYSLIIFTFVMIYSCGITAIFSSPGVGGDILAIHAVDFGLGFCSKLLPGAIYNLFFDSVGTVKTYIYLMVLLTAFFAVLSLLLEKFILRIDTEHRKTALIILAFFLSGPGTFAIHVYNPGMLDMYWVFCALMFFIFLSKKQLTPFIFLPFVLCITIYFASIICFIPFFVIILLYKISCSDTKKEKAWLWSVLVISVTAAVGLCVYFSACESGNLVYSLEEFHEIYSKKGVSDFFYFDQSLYKEIESDFIDEFAVFTLRTDSTIEKFIWEVALRINYHFSAVSIKDKTPVFALLAPVVCFIYAFLTDRIKINLSNKNRLKAFSNICMLILPVFTLLTSVFFSEDLIRWTGHAFLTLFSSFIFILYCEGKETIKWVEEQITKIPSAAFLLYFVFYAATVYHPYYAG